MSSKIIDQKKLDEARKAFDATHLSSASSPLAPLTIKCKLLSEAAKLPTKASQMSAGFDLYSAVDCIIPAGRQLLVDTKLSIELPCEAETKHPLCYGRIAPRSGLALKHEISIEAGVIDADYRGSLGVIMRNGSSAVDYVVKRGDRIAQLILERYISNAICCIADDLDNTARGNSGFGSSGK